MLRFDQNFINELIQNESVSNFSLVDSSFGYNSRKLLFVDVEDNQFFEYIEENQIHGIRRLQQEEIHPDFLLDLIFAVNH